MTVHPATMRSRCPMRVLVVTLALLAGCATVRPAVDQCPGPIGEPCGCAALYCRIPCSTCCNGQVPCPVDDPTACAEHLAHSSTGAFPATVPPASAAPTAPGSAVLPGAAYTSEGR